MSVITDILTTGKLPEVPLKVEVDNNSIIKLAGAAVIVVVICVLFATLIKRVK